MDDFDLPEGLLCAAFAVVWTLRADDLEQILLPLMLQKWFCF